MSRTTTRLGVALGVAVASAAALVATYAAAVRTAAGQALDTAVMVRLGDLVGSSTLPAEVLGLVSPTSVLLGTVLVVLLGLVVGGPRAAAAGGLTVVGAVLGAQVLKEVLVRPALLDVSSAYGSNSLPSGHTAAVAGLAAGLVVALGLHGRAWAWLVAGSLGWLAGMATVALQWHRPSDVVASLLLATGVAASAWLATGLARPTPEPTYARAA
ncbi:phosphatase PAP2 family protein [Nocardioides marmoraquaticus]